MCGPCELCQRVGRWMVFVLTGIGIKYGRGDIKWFVGALHRVVPSGERTLD